MPPCVAFRSGCSAAKMPQNSTEENGEVARITARSFVDIDDSEPTGIRDCAGTPRHVTLVQRFPPGLATGRRAPTATSQHERTDVTLELQNRDLRPVKGPSVWGLCVPDAIFSLLSKFLTPSELCRLSRASRGWLGDWEAVLFRSCSRLPDSARARVGHVASLIFLLPCRSKARRCGNPQQGDVQ